MIPPTGFTLHCGGCGKPMTLCVCVFLPTAPEEKQVQALEETRPRYFVRYGETYCTACELPVAYCKGHLG